MISYGSEQTPVRLDPWTRIVAVNWSTEYIVMDFEFWGDFPGISGSASVVVLDGDQDGVIDLGAHRVEGSGTLPNQTFYRILCKTSKVKRGDWHYTMHNTQDSQISLTVLDVSEYSAETGFLTETRVVIPQKRYFLSGGSGGTGLGGTASGSGNIFTRDGFENLTPIP